jgi:hypothetical protein
MDTGIQLPKADACTGPILKCVQRAEVFRLGDTKEEMTDTGGGKYWPKNNGQKVNFTRPSTTGRLAAAIYYTEMKGITQLRGIVNRRISNLCTQK